MNGVTGQIKACTQPVVFAGNSRRFEFGGFGRRNYQSGVKAETEILDIQLFK